MFRIPLLRISNWPVILFCENIPEILPALKLFPRGSFAGEKTFRFVAVLVRGVTGELTVSFRDEATRRVAGDAVRPALAARIRIGEGAALASWVDAEGRRPTLAVTVVFAGFTAESGVALNFFYQEEIQKMILR